MISDIDPRTIHRIANMHAVYRMFDRDEKLLYVGITGRARGARFDEQATKRFFPAVARITLEWHDCKASAESAEQRAIQNEQPRYNIAGQIRHAPRPRPAPAPRPRPEPARDVLAPRPAIGYDGQWHPACRRMHELLSLAGPQGTRPKVILSQLAAEGLGVTRQTVQRWLKEARANGTADQLAFGSWAARRPR